MATKTAISFGLLYAPVELHTATVEVDVRFNQLHKTDGARVKYKKVCAHCKEELASSDIVKGFQFAPDQYVTVTDEDLESIKSERDRVIHIEHTAKLSEIQPVYFEKTYHALPQPGAEMAYELLRAAMKKMDGVAIARTVLGTKETVLALVPRDEGILVQTLHYEAEVKAMPLSYNKPELDPKQLEMAVMIMESMYRPFDPSAFSDGYQERLRALIAAKRAGETITAPAEGLGNVIDIQEALTAMMAQKKGGKGSRKKAASQ